MSIWKSKYFCGKELTEHELKEGYINYRTLASTFDAVLCNDIISKTCGVVGEWEQENGGNDEEIEELKENIKELEDKEFIWDEKTRKYIDSPDYDELQEQIEELQEQIEELEDFEPEIFQYFIVSDEGANILKSYTNEIIYYNGELDIHVWGVTHFGTSWDYVNTSIKIDLENEEVQK